MNLQQAFQRLSWRFSNGQFTPNQNDVDALKFIAEWVNREKEERLIHNRHFAKITIAYYIDLLIYYKWDNYKTEKAIQEVLEQSLENWYTKFEGHMNTQEWITTADVIGFVDPWEATQPEPCKKRDWVKFNEIKKKNLEAINDLTTEQFTQSITKWNLQTITGKLNHFLTELLNKYGNTP